MGGGKLQVVGFGAPAKILLPFESFRADLSLFEDSGSRAYSIFFIYLSGAPGRIRTSDTLVRSQVLYPTELRARDLNLLSYLSLTGFTYDEFFGQWLIIVCGLLHFGGGGFWP